MRVIIWFNWEEHCKQTNHGTLTLFSSASEVRGVHKSNAYVLIFANALELHLSCTNPLTWFSLSICLFVFFCPTPFSYKLLFWLTQLIHSLCIKWILIISWMLYKQSYLQFILSSSTQLQDRVNKIPCGHFDKCALTVASLAMVEDTVSGLLQERHQGPCYNATD